MIETMQIDNNIEKLFQEVLRARRCYEAWWTLKSKRYRGKYNDVFQEYSEYFRVAIHTHFLAAILAISRLFDDDKNSLSLVTIRRNLYLKYGFGADDLRRYRYKMKAIRPSIEKVLKLRNKLFAHQDVGYDHEKAFKEVKIRPNDLKLITNSALFLVNILRRRRGFGVYSFKGQYDPDLIRIIRALKKVAI